MRVNYSLGASTILKYVVVDLVWVFVSFSTLCVLKIIGMFNVVNEFVYL